MTPQKALFRGVWDLVLVPPNGKPALGETPGHLGGRMRTRTCHGTSQIVAENVMRSTKNAKTAKPPMTSCEVVPSENGTTKIADFRFLQGQGTTGRSVIVVLPKHTFSSKTGAIYRTRPPQRPFSGVFGISFLRPRMANLHWAGRLGIQGVDCARVQALVPPKLWQKMRCGQEKPPKRSNRP